MPDAPESLGFFHLIADHWGTILTLVCVACGAVAFVWYTLKQTIPNLVEKINGINQQAVESIREIKKEIERLRHDQENLDRRATELGYAKKRDFFDKEGMPLFQLRSGCMEMRGDCTKERADLKHDICRKVEEVRSQVEKDVRAIHETLSEQSEEASTQAEKIKDILVRVERVVEKDKRMERREEMEELVEALGNKLADNIVGRIRNDSKTSGAGR